MVLYRLAGVVTAACMLHLNLVASDAACATRMAAGHGTMDGVHSSSATADANVSMAGHTAPREDRHNRGCDTPSRADCCQALASCAPIFTASASTVRLTETERVKIPHRVMELPRSTLVAPATPPPKA